MISIAAREAPPTFPRQIKNAYFKGARLTGGSVLYGIPLIALEAGSAQPGEQIPTMTGRLAGLAIQPALAGLTSAALVTAVGCPPAAAGIAGALLAAYVSIEIGNSMIRGLSLISKHGSEARRVAFGGDYEDTATARARRQRALRDISGALPASRQWLGQEALILHR